MDNKKRKKTVEVLAVIHLGNYDESGAIINDACPCCNWEPPPFNEKLYQNDIELECALGKMWHPATERGIGAFFQIFHCQNCGLVYATHIN